jgi:hypothetical protein
MLLQALSWGKTATWVFGRGTVAIEFQEVALEHGGASSWVIHFFELPFQIACIFPNTPGLHHFIGVEDISELKLKAIDVATNKAKSQRRVTAKRE